MNIEKIGDGLQVTRIALSWNQLISLCSSDMIYLPLVDSTGFKGGVRAILRNAISTHYIPIGVGLD